jgi:GntR family transcriptional regulator/MocR family aminotransferase
VAAAISGISLTTFSSGTLHSSGRRKKADGDWRGQMGWDLQLTVDRRLASPLHEQVRTQIVGMIKTGMLGPGVRLPSSRRLADDLNVARSVVVEAYQQLVAEGYLTSASRSGTSVSKLARSSTGTTTRGAYKSRNDRTVPVWDLRIGLADVSGFPRGAWLACLQQVLQNAAAAHLGYPPLTGTAQLREELAAYLGRVRAVRTVPEHVMITAGFVQGLSLLCSMLHSIGHETIGVEDPGDPDQRRFIKGVGLRTIPVPVDNEGADVHALAASGTRAVLLTPVRQFPTGVVLSAARREALVRWAERVDAVIIEDDHDGELWFDTNMRPPSVQGLAPQQVVYGSSASRTLAPGLRLGWLAVPPALMPALLKVRERQDLGESTIDQLTYAEFIHTGRLDRHLRQMRKRYRERFDTFARTLQTCLPEATVSGAAAGLHSFVKLPPTTDEQAVVHAAGQRGIQVYGASHFAFDRPAPKPGLVIGYATHSCGALARAITVLAETVRSSGISRRRQPSVVSRERFAPRVRTAG